MGFNVVILFLEVVHRITKRGRKYLSITDSREIGLKLVGSSVLPFLWITIVQVFFHIEGIEPIFQIMGKISVNNNSNINNNNSNDTYESNNFY